MSAPNALPGGHATWSVPDWLPTVAWLVVAIGFAVQIAYSPHATLAGSWCGDGQLVAAASILGHCPACYGLALALLMSVGSWFACSPRGASITSA